MIRIALVGLPGSGKSTIGRQLARRLSQPFVDSDHLFEQRQGCSIREYFEREGEASFRDAEEALIEEVTRTHKGVISTGGGCVLRTANRQHLHQRSHVLYLRSSAEEIFRRLRHDTNRPLLQVDDPLSRLRDLYVVRDPLYRETAHHVVEVGRPSAAHLLNMVMMQLELAGVVNVY